MLGMSGRFGGLGATAGVGNGLVKTLARPGGNITGLSSLGSDVGGKHLEMLLGVAPRLSRVAVLLNPGNQSHPLVLKSIQSAALKTSVTILPVEARTAPEIENAFSAMTQGKADAVIVARDGFYISQARQIAELALKNRLPSISEQANYAEAGGLMSYGVSQEEQFRRAATYVDKIFKGAKPADLPWSNPRSLNLSSHPEDGPARPNHRHCLDQRASCQCCRPGGTRSLGRRPAVRQQE